MDEGLLNDLLECSVCLERLDTSSRVLPCQHTFCLKCLKVIVESHKELRCPECRILVEAKVEELPPNVLLMRILEGMKNAPRKPSGTGHRVKAGHQLAQLQAGQQATRDGKQLPPHARAMYDYISKEQGDLSFKKGETILLQKKLDPFWYQGECSGRTGMFPITYVQVVVPLQATTALCKALYDFRMSAPDEEGCLAFDKGAIITVHRRVDENWAEGRLDQRVGIFPIAFVELNQPARQLMNSTPLNRPVPPLPEHARAGHSDHRHHAQQHPHRYQQMSMSTPAAAGNYQNMPAMSQSHPNYHTQMIAQPPQQVVVQPTGQHVGGHGGLVTTTAVPRAIVEPTMGKHSLDLIHFTAMHNKQQTMGLQVSRIAQDSLDRTVPRAVAEPVGGHSLDLAHFITMHNALHAQMGLVSRTAQDSLDRLRSVKFDSYNSTPVHNKVETTYQNVRTQEHAAPLNTALSSDSSSSMNTASSCGASSTPHSSCDSSSASPTPASPRAAPPDNDPPESSLNTSMGVLSLHESSTATNTSLNVSLPPSESPKLNASNTSATSQTQGEAQESSSNSEPRLDAPSSSKNAHRSSGPDSLLNFGIGLQAALSPSHAKEGNYMMARGHREHHHNREKRHSLTPSTHLQSGHSTQNRHSAEILATSLLDHVPERDRERPERERERERRRRRSRSNERPLPAAYIAVYPYKPQKPDELELKKGAVYTVTERCRDGWYKGCSAGAARCGVFPGNYVAPAPQPPAALPTRLKHDKNSAANTAATAAAAGPAPPDAPPRAHSPRPNNAQPLNYPWSSPSQTQPQQGTPRSEKSKEKSKAEKSSISTGVSLMKRLAAMKKCKSPPPVGYSMDNPVFEDSPGTSLMHHPVHVRSGSCPSQLLRALPGSERVRHKERPTVLCVHEQHSTTNEGPWQSQHRKSQSLDVTAVRRDRHHSQNVKERFRCIVPYPPNSEYELELKVDDIVLVSRKRGDGWYKGTLQRTGRTGLFPASFVQSLPAPPPE